MGKERCWVPHCKNSIKKFRHPSVLSFRFPVKDVDRCRQWVQNVGYEDLVYMPKETLEFRYVCIDHFTAEDLIKTGLRTKLTATAIPTRFPPQTAPLSDELANEWPPKLEWECGEAEPPKKKPKPVQKQSPRKPVKKQAPQEQGCHTEISSSSPEVNRKSVITSTSSHAAESFDDDDDDDNDDDNDHCDDSAPTPVNRPQDIPNLSSAAVAGLQEGDELLGFIVRRGTDIKIIPLQDESMMVAIHN